MPDVVTYLLSKHGQPTQTFIRNEVLEMRRQGVDVRVVALRRGDGPAAGPVFEVVSDMLVGRGALALAHLQCLLRRPTGYLRFLHRVALLRSELGSASEQVPWKRMPWVAQQVRRSGSRALHAHFAWAGATAACMLSPLTGLPWSFTMHAKDIFSVRRNLDVKLRLADRLITVCAYNRVWLHEQYGLTRPVDLVVCGVEVPEAAETATEVDVIAVGRLVAKKGIDLLVEAAPRVLEARPDLSVLVVGEGPLLDPLRERVDELGISSTVGFAGLLAHEEVLDRIETARVLCFPARVADDGDRDSMPVVIKEAMARGVPVVAAAVAGVPEMIDDTCGRLVEPDDAPALADALLSLLEDEPLRRRLGLAARQRVVDRFQLSDEVARLRLLLLDGAS